MAGKAGMSGIEAAECIKKSLPSTQVVRLSLDGGDRRCREAKDGAFAWVNQRRVKMGILSAIKGIPGEEKGYARSPA